MADETVALDDGRLRVSHPPGLHVVADGQHTRVPAGRRRVEVRLAVEVTGPLAGGHLTITMASRAGRLLTVLVAVEDGYEVVAASTVHALCDSPPLRFGEPGPLVFLNACRIEQAPSTRSEGGGFAEIFLRGGAGAFIGCLWSVGDKPAREFVAAFYQALDSGHTIARATLAGRHAAREAGDISWLSYTVYAHPDARLANRPPRKPTPPRKASPWPSLPKQPVRPQSSPGSSSGRSIPSWSA